MKKVEMKNIIQSKINESIIVQNKVKETLEEEIIQSAEIIIKSFKRNGKLLICGNGGSAADSQHFAAEIVGRFKKERKALPAISLTVDTSILTAWGNDYSFDTIFSRQIEAIGKKGDVLFGISTSGNSKNVIEAFKTANKIGLYTIALTGNKGGKIKKYAKLNIIVPNNDTARIQEAHILIIHILCSIIENALF